MKHLLRAASGYIGISALLLFFGLPAAYAAYGEAPTFAGSSTNAPFCGNTAPKVIWPFSAKAGAGGTVNLSWGKTENAGSWTVAYGVAPHTYIYGISNFGNGDSRSIQVKSLPGGTYYFAMRANNGCMPGPFSNEWKVVVGGGGLAFMGGQQSGLNVVPAASPQITPPVGGYTPPAGGNQGVPLNVGAPVVPSTPPAAPSFWQGILNFFSGLFGGK